MRLGLVLSRIDLVGIFLPSTKRSTMASSFKDKPTISYNEQRSDIDMMLLNDATTPTPYDEKIPRLRQEHDLTKPVPDYSATNEKELASPVPSTSSLDNSTLPTNARTLTLHHASFPWRNVNISTATGTPAYFAEISEATSKKPDILLRRPDRDGACVGRSHFRLSRSMRLCLGEGELETEWVELKSSALFSKGAFEFVFQGREYRLQRTHATEHGVEGLQKASLSHFKVVEVGSEEVVAVYVSETYHPARMKGALRLGEGVEVGGDLEVLVVMGVVGWREKMRRRAAYSGNAGSAGGGG